MTIRVNVIASSGHGKNPLQKRVMTIQVAVIASGAKQSRLRRLYLDCFVPRNDGVTRFVIASGAKQSRLSRLYLDCFVYFDTSTSSVHRFAQQPHFDSSTGSLTTGSMHRLAMTCYKYRHCETRAWDKSSAKKSDDDTGRRHCEARSNPESKDCFVSCAMTIRQTLVTITLFIKNYSSPLNLIDIIVSKGSSKFYRK